MLAFDTLVVHFVAALGTVNHIVDERGYGAMLKKPEPDGV